MPTTPLIAYANVGKTFDGGRVVAVDDVSLEVAEGEFLAIVGGSGSGKTTLLRLANRLIEADLGSITVEGEDVRNVDPILLRRRIGSVFQSGGLSGTNMLRCRTFLAPVIFANVSETF